MRILILTTLVLGMALFGLQAQASANLLADPGFDAQAKGWLGWNTTPWWGGGGGGGKDSGGAAEIVNTQSRSPSNSVRLFGWGKDWSYGMVAQTVTKGIVGSEEYEFSAYFKRTANVSTSAVFKVEWLDAGGKMIGYEADVGTAKFDKSYAANSWTAVSNKFVSPPGAVGAKCEVVYSKAAGASGDISVDDISFDVTK